MSYNAPPEETLFVVELDGGHSSGEISDDPLEKSVSDGEADEHLELVIFAQPGAGGLYLGDELGVHPPQLSRPRHGAGARAGRHFLG